MAATNKYLRAMAAPDKCLAQSNKSRTGGEATKKREISQSSLVGNGVCGRCAVSGLLAFDERAGWRLLEMPVQARWQQ